MNKLRLLALLAVAALVLFPAVAMAAETPPEPPCRFHGSVQVDGADVEDGTIITATIEGAEYTGNTTDSTYSIVIQQPADKDYASKTVTFKIGANAVEQTGVWEKGGNKKVDLSIGEAVGPGGCVCKITSVVLGNTTKYDSATGVITIDKSAITGPQGPAGAAGPAGAKGEPGKNASNVMGIVAIVIAAIALIVAVVVMLRKKPA